MLLASLPFLYIFLPTTFIVWWLLTYSPLHNARIWWLLLCSLAFYGYTNAALLPLLLGSITANFFLSSLIQPRTPRGRVLAGLGVAGNLLLLGYYKYAGFLPENVHASWGGNMTLPAMVLPLGISFFTFQQIAYLVDRSRGAIAMPPWSHYTLSVVFFPKITAGPIVRSEEVIAQAAQMGRAIVSSELMAGLTLLAIGLSKKTILADTFALWADSVFANPQGIHTLDAWVGTLSYTFQIYFDFSGYSDMAIGAALLFGIRLPANFLSPYAAHSITEFWRRWHRTLGRFLWEYLYIPLGGNKGGIAKTVRNALVVMVLCGLWHGAAWGFVLWGILHGVALGVHRCWVAIGGTMNTMLAWILTFAFVVLSWVPFRASGIADALALWNAMIPFGRGEDVTLTLPYTSVVWCLCASVLCMLTPNSMQIVGYSREQRIPMIPVPRAVLAGVMFFIATIPLLLKEETPFIYIGF